jgi:hypothetical protein
MSLEEDTIKVQTTAESPSSGLESQKEKMMKEGNTSMDWSRHISTHATHQNPPSFDDSILEDSFAVEDDELIKISPSSEDQISESQTEAKDT